MGNKKTWKVKTEVQRGYISGDFSNNLHLFTKSKQKYTLSLSQSSDTYTNILKSFRRLFGKSSILEARKYSC